MGFLKNIFRKERTAAVADNASFWNWFLQHERAFYTSVKTGKQVERNFLDLLVPQLQALNKRYYCLTGMCEPDTVELVITAEGDIKTFVFVEELIAAAPALPGWRFTALKPPAPSGITIEMDGHRFDDKKISFTWTARDGFPDEIDLIFVHADYTESNKKTISNGVFIYLDNVLGELNAATLIDHAKVTGNQDMVHTDLVPVGKLPEFLLWRQKEFVEKYDGIRQNNKNGSYAALEGEGANGLPLVAIIDKELLDWDAKASHPWMMALEIRYNQGNNGMPDKETFSRMVEFETELEQHLLASEGYLHLGRKTFNSQRTIYYACKEFRGASRTAVHLIEKHRTQLDISYEIYKDKYWRTMDPFKGIQIP